LELWLPYGQTEIPIRIPDDNFYRILEPSKQSATSDVRLLVENALNSPLGGLRLNDIVKPGAKAGIIVDPIVPLEARKQAIEAISSRLSQLGAAQLKVFARKRTSVDQPLEDGSEPLDPSGDSFSDVGKTAFGTSVELDTELESCETKVMVGLVMPHFAAGFTGGPEAIIPSSSSIRSITKNRSLITKGFPELQGSADSPVLSDSLDACRLVGPIYGLSFVPDGLGGVCSVLGGELELVFREGVKRYLEHHNPRLERKLDIVVVSAGSLGKDLYHAVRVVANVLGAVRRGGTVILVAECSRGIGDPVFLDYARRFPDRRELSTELRYRFRLGGHVNLYLQEVLEKCRVQIVSVLPELFVRDAFNLKPSQTASEAVQRAIRVEGKESKILIVPRGEFTVPTMESS
jgi:nickel-dependent lactate racemase